MAKETLGTDQLLPFERGEAPAEANSLFSALEAELGSEEPKGEDKPPAEEGDEPEDAGSEEEAPEDGEESEDESGEGDEEDVEEEEEPVLTHHRVKVDGKEIEVSLQELKDGYSRTADYMRKTQAVAEDRRKTEAEAAQLRSARDQYAGLIEAQALTLKRLQPKEPDWDKLREENPTQYAVLRADHQRFKDELREVETEQRRVYEERTADFQRQQAAHLEEQKAKLYEAIPEWKDQVQEKTEKTKLADYLTGTYGWTQDDLATVTDHRLMVALRKAMLYDEGRALGKEKIRVKLKASTRPLRAGSRERVARPEKKAAKSARQQLKRSGRAEDAAAYIATMLE